jgi:hypothetical protein
VQQAGHIQEFGVMFQSVSLRRSVPQA